MEKINWFYQGILLMLIIGNSIGVGIQEGKKKIINVIQIIIFVGVLIWYIGKIGELTPGFFFVTSVLFLLTYSLELFQYLRGTKTVSDFIMLIVSVLPIILTLGFFSGFFL